MAELPDWLWSSWQPRPASVLFLLLMLLPYLAGVARLWNRAGRGNGISVWQVTSFAVGYLLLALALVSPLETAAGMLFSVHMIQHMLLAFVAAPLLAYGSIGLAAIWSLPAAGRRGFSRWWLGARGLRKLLSLATHPVTVWIAFFLSFWIWHLPGAYEAALRSPALHWLEHVSMFGSAYLFWWLVIQPVGRRRLNLGATLLFVLAASIQGTILSTLLTFAPAPLYESYVTSAQVLGVSALEDQQLAGLIMRTPAGLIYLFTAIVLFLKWISQLERRDLEFG